MQPFLKSIAKAYASRYGDMSEFCFVFPNKRAGTFFENYLRSYARRHAMVAPKVTSIADFVEDEAGVVIDSRLDLLFRIYVCYKRVVTRLRGSKEGEKIDFGSYRSLGETVMSDFDEVERYVVDADEIFQNLKDYKDIATDYLTDEQRRVMEDYFGRREDIDVGRFWRSFPEDDNKNSKIQRRFLYLWEVLGPLYHELRHSLARDGLAMPGTAYRLTLDRVRSDSYQPKYKKIIFVGFNALSTAERLIFEQLASLSAGSPLDGEPLADFFWDAAGPVLTAKPGNSASTFVEKNIRRFPAPEWALPYLRLSDTDSLPENISVVAAPSNSIQTKIAGQVAAEYMRKAGEENVKNARVAVVLPDENLLIPMLYSMPEEVKDVNLTMGYPIRLTSAASFVTLLRRLYVRGRQSSGGATSYNADDLRTLLAHPYSQLLVGKKDVTRLTAYMDYHHLMWISTADIARLSEECGRMLPPLDKNAGADMVMNYLGGLFARLVETMSTADGTMVKNRIDVSHIEVYMAALNRLAGCLRNYQINLTFRDIFNLTDRLVAGEKMRFEGEPLVGLQVMGTLETRAIDFDYLVVVSANEGIMPGRMRKRTFIPNTLRAGYGMPASSYEESIFAYYFYRMISRVKEVTLIYDARSGEMKSGEMSRYIRQLQYLYAPGKVKFDNLRFTLTEDASLSRKVEKTPAVMKRLEPFLIPGSKVNLSASMLKKYVECPLRFYVEGVLGVNADSPAQKYMTAAEMGNIVHRMMMEVYLPPQLREKFLDAPVIITAATIDSLLGNEEKLRRHLQRVINSEFLHLKGDDLDRELSGSATLIGKQLLRQVKEMLHYDRRFTPFELLGCEVKDTISWPLTDGRSVNMKFAIDRIDRIPTEAGPTLRIIDYKSGQARVGAKNVAALFENSKSDHLFQLLLYAEILARKVGDETPVMLRIYETDKMHIGGEKTPPMLVKEKGEYHSVKDEFREEFDAMLTRIFDSTTPFVMDEDEESCEHCNLKQICGRGE